MKDREPLIFARVKNGLFPKSEGAWEALRTLAPYAEVRVSLTMPRNLDRLKAYWAMLHEAIDATGCAPNVDALHVQVKEGLGYVDAVLMKNGAIRYSVRSVAFDKMAEDEFKRFFNEAQQWLAENVGFGG